MSDKLEHSPEELLSESFKAYDSLLQVAVFANRQLKRELGDLDIALEDVRNRRQEAAVQFEAIDKIAAQYINMLASVLKTMGDLRSHIIRNLR